MATPFSRSTSRASSSRSLSTSCTFSKRLCWRAASSNIISSLKPVARMADRLQQRAPVGAQKLHHAIHLVPVLLAPHHLLARAQAHRHLAVDAARMLGRGHQVLLAAAHLEQVQKLRLRTAPPKRASGTARSTGPRVRVRCVVMWLRGNSLPSTIFTYGGMRSFIRSQIRLRKMPPRLFVEAPPTIRMPTRSAGTRCAPPCAAD